MNRSQTSLAVAFVIALTGFAACSESESPPGVDTTRGTGGTGGSSSTGVGGARPPVGPQTKPGTGGMMTSPPATMGDGGADLADASGDAGGDATDGGRSDGAADATSEAGAGDTATGALVFTGDFSMMGDRLCFKSGATGGTGNRSPELMWDGAPPETRSFAVTLHDTNNNNGHWAAWNIPATAKGLAAAISTMTLPMGARQTGNWFGPGAGEVHRYEYKLWPLRVATLPGNPSVQALRSNILPMNVIGEGKIIFAYGNRAAMCM
ncbi:MAG TPA: YbhB/YbcL family Raf kinase inhibitor-like protein [Polyangia bacterium]